MASAEEPDFAFARQLHDRAGHLRSRDVDWKTPELRVLVLAGEHVATIEGPALRWIGIDEAPEGQWIFLGTHGGAPYAAVVVSRVEQEFQPTSIRVLAPMLSVEELSLGIHAVAMARWLQTHVYCSRCGEYLYAESGGHLLRCPECGAQHFPRTDPAVIMLITDDQDRALLARNPTWPEGRFSTLAGFVEPGESLEDTVRREVAEEVGVQVGEVSYLASQPWPFPSSLMLGFFGRALTTDIVPDEDEIAEARWFTREELRDLGTSNEVVLPPAKVSISRWLIERWFGGPIPGEWS